jgi:hypothetical protein
MDLKSERMIKAKESMANNELLLKQRQEEIRRREVEETKKCEEEVSTRNKLNAARSDLEKKHFEECEKDLSFIIVRMLQCSVNLIPFLYYFHSSKCCEEGAFRQSLRHAETFGRKRVRNI